MAEASLSRSTADPAVCPPDVLLCAEGLVFGFERPFLRGVDLRISGGECVALLGANGAGKTTLLRLLGGLIEAHSGLVKVDGIASVLLSHEERARRIGYLPQRIPMATGFAVYEMVLMGMYALLPARGWESQREWLAVGRALHRVGARRLMRRSFDELSGGEQRRVLLARALVAHPRLLLLDEPLAALDPGFVLELTATLSALKTAGVGLVISTHRLSLVRLLADQVIVLRRGAVLASGPPSETLSAALLDEAYGTDAFSHASVK